jgi:sulfate adenylyltransferase subunit 1 (EFTu-like GTPase family)
MSKELTRAELEEVYIEESKTRVAEIENIIREVTLRMDDVREISAKIVAGDVRSVQEIHSLTTDIENHLARVKELKAKAEAIRAENLMDLVDLTKD